MNLQQLNEKYHGRPIDFRSWKFPTFGAPPNMGFGFEAQFSDGKIYGVKGKIVVEGMETPSEIRGGKGAFGSLKEIRIVDAYEKEVEGGGTGSLKTSSGCCARSARIRRRGLVRCRGSDCGTRCLTRSSTVSASPCRRRLTS